MMFLRRLSPVLPVLQRFVQRSRDIPILFQIHEQVCKLQYAAWPCHVGFNEHLYRYRSISSRSSSTQATSYDESENTSNGPTPKQDVIITGKNVPDSCDSFQDIGLEEHVLLELHRLGFQKPTTIQGNCIPIVLSGRDMVGIGQTGSGKTLAYVLPALIHLNKFSSQQRGNSPKVLILAPTRELAQQIQGVVRSFHDLYRVTSTCLYGGVSKLPQMNKLENGVDICIATPGRLIDLVENGATALNQISYLVLDEADRMLDMGFEPQVREIVSKITCPHQTLMWSATWPRDVRELAADFMQNEIQVTVGSTELMANPNIRQNIHICTEEDKEKRLLDLVNETLSERKSKILIFAQTKRDVDKLTRTLVWNKYPTTCVHGDKSQMQRDKALHDFRRSVSRVLIATDVAARGLDITDITHIINYDFPTNIETYVHRIGRTARAEKTGTAHSFFTPSDANMAKELVDVLMACNQTVHPGLMDLSQRSYSPKKSFVSHRREAFRSKDSFFNRTNSSYQKSHQRSTGSRWNRRSEDFV